MDGGMGQNGSNMILLHEKYMKIVSEYSKSLTLIGRLYPNLIMYAKGRLGISGITYSRIYNLYPLKEMIQEYPLKNAKSF